jgi:hypothetical protein
MIFILKVYSMKKMLDYVTSNFGYDTCVDFINSLIHFKFLIITIPLSLISVALENYLGIHFGTLIGFSVLLLLELVTGLVASRIKKVKIVSSKFGRFGLKFGVWITILFIMQTMKIEYRDESEILFTLYDWLHKFILTYVTFEYLISVLENLSVITGKNMNPVILILKKVFNRFVGEDVIDDKKN